MKIELTEKEKQLIDLYTAGKLENPSGETRDIICQLSERALAYEIETKSEDDPDDLLAWYYEKYKEQENGNKEKGE